MCQAIEEEFIVDVLKNYMTYKAYYKPEKTIEDDLAIKGRKSTRRHRMKTLYDYVAEGAVTGDRFCIVGFDPTRSKHNYTDDLPLRHPLLKDREIVTLVETPDDSVNGTIRFGFVEQEQVWRGRNTARMLVVEPFTQE